MSKNLECYYAVHPAPGVLNFKIRTLPLAPERSGRSTEYLTTWAKFELAKLHSVPPEQIVNLSVAK